MAINQMLGTCNLEQFDNLDATDIPASNINLRAIGV